MIRQLGHLCFISDNMNAMANFYCKVMGLEIKFEFRNADEELFGFYLDCGNSTFIEIFDRVLKQKQWGGKLEDLTPGNRYGHFCFEVAALADFKAALEAKGVKVSEIRTGMDHSLQAWTADPDGNAIELMQYTRQSLEIQRQVAGVMNVARPAKT